MLSFFPCCIMDEPCCAGVPSATETSMLSAQMEIPAFQLFNIIQQKPTNVAVYSVLKRLG